MIDVPLYNNYAVSCDSVLLFFLEVSPGRHCHNNPLLFFSSDLMKTC